MTGKNRTAGKFKSKAAIILSNKKSRPDSMEDFLKDTQKHQHIDAQLHETANPQNHNCTNEHSPQTTKTPKEELGRLHIQIRQDLIEKLLEAVFKRKRDRKIKNRSATQKAVIEEALEKYFMQEIV